MIASCIVNIDQGLIVHGACPHLIVAGRKQLDHIIPVCFILCLYIFQTDLLQTGNHCVHKCQRIFCHMITAEVRSFKRLAVNLVHRTCRIGDCRYLICIIFFPPVHRRCNIYRYKNLTDKLAVIAPRPPQPLCQIKVIGSKYIPVIFVVIAVHACPAVHWISGAPHCVFEIHYTCFL